MVVAGAEVEPERRGRRRGQSQPVRQDGRARQVGTFSEARRKTENVETAVLRAE